MKKGKYDVYRFSLPFRRWYDSIDHYQCEEDHEHLLNRLKTQMSDCCSSEFFESHPSIEHSQLKIIESHLVQALQERKVRHYYES